MQILCQVSIAGNEAEVRCLKARKVSRPINNLGSVLFPFDQSQRLEQRRARRTPRHYSRIFGNHLHKLNKRGYHHAVRMQAFPARCYMSTMNHHGGRWERSKRSKYFSECALFDVNEDKTTIQLVQKHDFITYTTSISTNNVHTMILHTLKYPNIAKLKNDRRFAISGPAATARYLNPEVDRSCDIHSLIGIIFILMAVWHQFTALKMA